MFSQFVFPLPKKSSNFSPPGQHEMSVLIELALGHRRSHSTDVVPKSNSPSDYVFRTDQLPKEATLNQIHMMQILVSQKKQNDIKSNGISATPTKSFHKAGLDSSCLVMVHCLVPWFAGPSGWHVTESNSTGSFCPFDYPKPVPLADIEFRDSFAEISVSLLKLAMTQSESPSCGKGLHCTALFKSHRPSVKNKKHTSGSGPHDVCKMSSSTSCSRHTSYACAPGALLASWTLGAPFQVTQPRVTCGLNAALY